MQHVQNTKTCDTCRRRFCSLRDVVARALQEAPYVQSSDPPARPFGDIFLAIGWRCDRYQQRKSEITRDLRNKDMGLKDILAFFGDPPEKITEIRETPVEQIREDLQE